MLYNKDQEVIQQGLGGYTTRIRSLLSGLSGYPHQSRDALSPVCGIFVFMIKNQNSLVCIHICPFLVNRNISKIGFVQKIASK